MEFPELLPVLKIPMACTCEWKHATSDPETDKVYALCSQLLLSGYGCILLPTHLLPP